LARPVAKVDDGKSAVSEANVSLDKLAFAIGPAVGYCIGHALYRNSVDDFANWTKYSGYAAHLAASAKRMQCIHHTLIVFVTHAVMQRNRHRLLITILRARKVPGLEAKALAVQTQHVDGMGARPGTDALALQILHHRITRHRRARRINITDEGLPAVAASNRLLWQA